MFLLTDTPRILGLFLTYQHHSGSESTEKIAILNNPKLETKFSDSKKLPKIKKQPEPDPKRPIAGK